MNKKVSNSFISISIFMNNFYSAAVACKHFSCWKCKYTEDLNLYLDK